MYHDYYIQFFIQIKNAILQYGVIQYPEKRKVNTRMDVSFFHLPVIRTRDFFCHALHGVTHVRNFPVSDVLCNWNLTELTRCSSEVICQNMQTWRKRPAVLGYNSSLIGGCKGSRNQDNTFLSSGCSNINTRQSG